MTPDALLFQSTHEWVQIAHEGGDKIATVGISAFAVEQLTDLVFLDLPKVGTQVEVGKEFGEVESVKAVSPLYSPVTGQIIEVNSSLPDNLETLGQDPYGEGWMLKVRITDETTLTKLMDLATYEKQCAEEA